MLLQPLTVQPCCTQITPRPYLHQGANYIDCRWAGSVLPQQRHWRTLVCIQEGSTDNKYSYFSIQDLSNYIPYIVSISFRGNWWNFLKESCTYACSWLYACSSCSCSTKWTVCLCNGISNLLKVEIWGQISFVLVHLWTRWVTSNIYFCWSVMERVKSPKYYLRPGSSSILQWNISPIY